jgi:hypothetical protein
MERTARVIKQLKVLFVMTLPYLQTHGETVELINRQLPFSHFVLISTMNLRSLVRNPLSPRWLYGGAPVSDVKGNYRIDLSSPGALILVKGCLH